MSPKDVPVIFDVVVTLDKTESEVADCSKERFKERDQNDPVPLVDGEEREDWMPRGGQDDSESGAHDEANDEAPVESFPGFLWGDSFIELMLAEIDATKISGDVVEHRADESKEQKFEGAEELVSGSVCEFFPIGHSAPSERSESSVVAALDRIVTDVIESLEAKANKQGHEEEVRDVV